MEVKQELFETYAFYAALLVAKMCIMSALTARHRIQKKIFANPEDASGSGLDPKAVVFGDPDVERVRRAHLNDIENIVPFLFLGALYLTTGPSHYMASLLFKTFTAARFIHTFVYLYAVPQPSRVLAFLVGFLINLYLAYAIIVTFK